MSIINRRGALRLIGGAPIVAKRVIDKLSGTSFLGEEAQQAINEYGAPLGIGGQSSSNLLSGRLLVAFFKKIGIPGFKRKEFRRYARLQRVLDPDIAVLRSVSVSHKLHMQWRRNEKKREQMFYDEIIEREDRMLFMEKNGTDYF